jgi:predicted RNA-binding Zn ribbon-like protein
MPKTWKPTDLVGGVLCLDLANTAGAATKARDYDRLVDYKSLVAWACAAGGVSRGEAVRLANLAADRPRDAERALIRVRQFRETLYRTIRSLLCSEARNPDDQKRVAECIAKAQAGAALVALSGRFAWRIDVTAAGPDLILARAALSAADLFARESVDRIRECGRCSWLFLDRSRNGRRRWCSSLTCGNRERVQRHYCRQEA